MGDFNVTIRVHTDTLARALKKRMDNFKEEMLNDEMKLEAAKLYAQAVEHYVPMREGTLRDSVDYPRYKGTRAVRYDTKYATAQYEGYNGRGVIRKYSTEGTIDHWNKHLKPMERDAYYEEVKQAIIARMKDG